jgi:acetyl/propionyl-CoA carboxylase alpha subunit/acetyl-CoA carboxylase carboxyltransferase component
MLCPFRRIAIVNRGEAAMRLVHAVRDLKGSQEQPVEAVALFTDPDRGSMFVRYADAAVPLGPATFVDSDGRRKNSYLDYDRLAQSLIEAQADAAWVGWGFVAEQAEFAELCDRLGITFIGPTPEAMRQLGDKIASKMLAEKADVPVAPWSGGPVPSLEEARSHADRIGYPLMIKATAGGGGRGIRRVYEPNALADAFESARAEASRSFGDSTVFLERLLPVSRHIEVQMIADHHGVVWPVGIRDCTIQRRNQKVAEESASVALTPAEDQQIRDAAARLCRLAGYTNAGTVEFLYDPLERRFSFMEVNARLQVEHPVTEETTGVDLVKLQLHVAAGGRLDGEAPVSRGHAIEVRLNAEDPEKAFTPAPGRVDLLRLPTGPGIRIDAGVSEGDTIPSEFDSMIAKIIAWGEDRPEALARLTRALVQTEVVVRGGSTNRAFLLALLKRPEVVSGAVDVGWLDRLAAANEHVPRDHLEVALLVAAVEAYDDELADELTEFFAWASRGRAKVRPTVGHAVDLEARGKDYRFDVYRLGPSLYRVVGAGGEVELKVDRTGQFERRVTVNGRSFRVLSVLDGRRHLLEVDGVAHQITRETGGVVRAPAPAIVVSVFVHEGDEVAAGDRLVVLEAMKMEVSIVAPMAGRVGDVLVVPNVQVDAAAPLVKLHPLGESLAAGEAGTAADLTLLAGSTRDDSAGPTVRCQAVLGALRRQMLGFDVDPLLSKELVTEYGSVSRRVAPDARWLVRAEDEVITVFADACSLARTRPDVDALPGEGAHSAHEDLLLYLRSIEGRGEGLPASFVHGLERALAHYGVHDLEPSPQLREALLWIVRAQERVTTQVPAIQSILDRRLEHLEHVAPVVDESFPPILDRLISATQRRFPDLARQSRDVRYHYFERPGFEQAADHAYVEAAHHLDALEQGVGGAERELRMTALVDCPQPLKNFLTRQFSSATFARREAMLEALTRRYYRIRELESYESVVAKGRLFGLARYQHEGRRIQLMTTFANYEELQEAGSALGRLAREKCAGGDEILADFYVWQGDPAGDDAEAERAAATVVASMNLPRSVSRVVVAVSAPGRGLGMAGIQHFTYRRSGEDGYREDVLYRGIHPMMGIRLRLPLLQNFQLARMPSLEDVYLFHGVARDNPSDERLFAMIEVRDVAPVYDDAGRTIRLSGLERKLGDALAAVSAYQAARPPERRLHMNQVTVYVWPLLELSEDEIHAIVHRLAPSTEGLGIDQINVRARFAIGRSAERETLVQLSNPTGAGVVVRLLPYFEDPVHQLTGYEQRVTQLRRRGLVYPYELIKMLTPARDHERSDFPPGEFIEYDLDNDDHLLSVARDFGKNASSIVVGVISNAAATYPEGMSRVALLGDPSKGLGSLAEPECKRIIAALDLAERRGLPVEWFALSAGAKIAMDSGTENMDWIARVLRRIILFTQAGRELNVVVAGINVGAQPYWNAEATMLMHTKGLLIMTPESAMVLTGKQALDYSGGVSAEDNQGIGGYERVMGPNGQAQYWAPDMAAACRILLQHYEHTYVAPGERFPRRAATADPSRRDVRSYPHGGPEFDLVGDVFDEATNPGRKKPFDIRSVMRSVIDQDRPPLERWAGFRHAESAVVWDAHLDGWPVCLIGLESRNLPRQGFVPADGPDHWTSGTLFPRSSKKVARAINAASGNRPLVVLANLSGFDGSPESMRRLQLEYGAEIGRAVVNFNGPMVFCVVSRYHGGAFVVFSATLNDSLEVAAVEGSYASVIGGAPAAAVVFAREVDARANTDPRVRALRERIEAAKGAEKTALRAEEAALYDGVRSEKLGEVADEFDAIHSVQRAEALGSVHRIIPAADLRPYLAGAVQRGIERELIGRRPDG